MKSKPKPSVKVLTPLKAIRTKCLDCCCGQKREVQLCPCTDCSLYPYRLGRNPNVGKQMSYDQRMLLVARFKKTPTPLLG
ncbi:MAG: hypothetical protein LBC20_06470 [Planctomycetaceae bacterium]|jgi:hypothetical protein|nr:hypothetical protein [Planctomycetaceae bacterium]